jgi:hypothetical protein
MAKKLLLLICISLSLSLLSSFKFNRIQTKLNIEEINEPITVLDIDDYSSSKDFPLMIMKFNDKNGIEYKWTYYGGIILKDNVNEQNCESMEMKLEVQGKYDKKELILYSCSIQSNQLINIFKRWLNDNSKAEFKSITFGAKTYLIPSHNELLKRKVEKFIRIIESHL